MLMLGKDAYRELAFEREAELEEAINSVENELYGPSRIYLDVKKKIGKKGGTRNIPDGYLIDLSSKKEPVLYVVENELAKHDTIKHIAVQILEFSLSFETTPQKVKAILKDAINQKTSARRKIDDYLRSVSIDNVDHLLDVMIHESPLPFRALVVIDAVSDELEKVLTSRFQFPVEILTFERFQSASGALIYKFEPFLNDVTPQAALVHESSGYVDPSDLDTIVVPAREDGYEEVFLGENRWYAIRIHSSMIPKLKYIAAYQVRPVSAITDVAEIASIERWPESTKYVVNFKETAQKMGPIALVKDGSVKAPQNLRYTSYERLCKANNLDEVFG